jgi:hypothetical protein
MRILRGISVKSDPAASFFFDETSTVFSSVGD